MFLMVATKKGGPAKEIQTQLRLRRYEPVWMIVHKLRKPWEIVTLCTLWKE